MTTVYSYGGGSQVLVKTRSTLGTNALVSPLSYGKVVDQWRTQQGKTTAQEENLTALQATSAGSFAVKYHMDYTRVLEDALDSYVVSKATKVMYYAGVVDWADLVNLEPGVAVKTF
jgi:hypothetical protein